MTVQETIQSHMADAMRSKDALRLSVLRMMKTAVKNKEIEKMKALEEPEVFAVLNSLVKQRRDSVEQFRNGGREELARKEEAEIKVIEEIEIISNFKYITKLRYQEIYNNKYMMKLYNKKFHD